jgi:hypothetical protein
MLFQVLDDNPSFSKNLVHSFISIKLASLKRCLSLGSDSNSSGRRPALKMTVLVLILVFSNVLVMEISCTDVESGRYILVSYAHSNTSIKTNTVIFNAGLRPEELESEPPVRC